MNKTQKLPIESHWRITGILAVVLALAFFWPLIGVICFAAIMAFLFYPMFKWLDKHMPQVAAIAVTILASVAIVAIPIIISMTVAIAQGIELAGNVGQALDTTTPGSVKKEVEEAVENVNAAIAPVTNGQVYISMEAVRGFISDTVPILVKSLVNILVGFAGNLPTLITFATVYLFLFAAFLASGKSTLEQLRVISPFNDKTTSLYFMRTGGMIKASMMSQLLIAFILSFLTALLLLLIGAGPYFLFLVVLMTLLNMIPVGSSIVVYPLSVIAILLGNVAGGLWVIVIYSFVICSLDNVLRPRLIPKSVQLAPALMTLAIFCGIFYFGLLGVVYGPVIAIVLLTTLETYIDYRRRMVGKQQKEVKV